MIKKIRGYFGMEGAEDVSLLGAADHTKIAIATVLVASANADSNLAPAERAVLIKQLETRLGIKRDEAVQLEKQVESEEDQAVIQKYIAALRELSVAQREAILSLAWQIIAVDKKIEDDETRFAAQLRHNLGLSIEQSIRARKLSQNFPEGFKEVVEASQEMHDAIQIQLQGLHPGKK